MPKKNYAAVMAEINKKIERTGRKEADKAIYRVRAVFSDTSFLNEASKSEAQKAK